MAEDEYNWDSLPENPLLPGPDGEPLGRECSDWLKENFGEHGPFTNIGDACGLAIAAFEAGYRIAMEKQ